MFMKCALEQSRELHSHSQRSTRLKTTPGSSSLALTKALNSVYGVDFAQDAEILTAVCLFLYQGNRRGIHAHRLEK